VLAQIENEIVDLANEEITIREAAHSAIIEKLDSATITERDRLFSRIKKEFSNSDPEVAVRTKAIYEGTIEGMLERLEKKDLTENIIRQIKDSIVDELQRLYAAQKDRMSPNIAGTLIVGDGLLADRWDCWGDCGEVEHPFPTVRVLLNGRLVDTEEQGRRRIREEYRRYFIKEK
jgi:hypothetical protein